MTRRDWAMEVIGRVDPALIEEADRVRVSSPWRRMRACVLAAACIGLLSVSVVMAVNLIAGGYKSVKYIEDGFLHLGGEAYQYYSDLYYLEGGQPAFLPLDQLTEEAKALAVEGEAGGRNKSFSSWQRAEEFYNITFHDLHNNAIFDQLPPSNHSMTSTYVSSSPEGITSVWFSEHWYRVRGVPGLNLSIEAYVLTELMDMEGMDLTSGGCPPSGSEYSTEEYYGKNISAFIAHVKELPRNDSSPTEYYSAHFILNGVQYKVITSCEEDIQQARELLIEIIDGF